MSTVIVLGSILGIYIIGKLISKISNTSQTKTIDEEIREVKPVEYRNGYIKINEIDFVGHYKESPDGRYILAYREHLKPKFILLKDEEILFEKKYIKSHDVDISNNGNIVINNWTNPGQMLSTFYAFNRKGNAIIINKFEANLHNNAISPDGRYAVCQSCDSINPEDSNKLCFFDLKEGYQLWSVTVKDFADSYYFDLSKRELVLEYDDERKPDSLYSFQGQFLEKKVL